MIYALLFALFSAGAAGCLGHYAITTARGLEILGCAIGGVVFAGLTAISLTVAGREHGRDGGSR